MSMNYFVGNGLEIKEKDIDELNRMLEQAEVINTDLDSNFALNTEFATVPALSFRNGKFVVGTYDGMNYEFKSFEAAAMFIVCYGRVDEFLIDWFYEELQKKYEV